MQARAIDETQHSCVLGDHGLGTILVTLKHLRNVPGVQWHQKYYLWELLFGMVNVITR